MNKIMSDFRRSDFVILAAIILLVIGTAFSLGCDTGGGGGDGDADADSDGDGIVDAQDVCDDAYQCEDVSGNWHLDVGQIESTCGIEDGWSSDIVIYQNGCTLEVTGIKDAPPSYVVSGCALKPHVWFGPGYFDEGGGRTTTTFTMEIVGPVIMTGKETWYWVSEDDAYDTCTEGKAVVVATKMP